MNSGLIGKIEKAHRYAQEPHRIRIESLTAKFDGDNNVYVLRLEGEGWTCDCHTSRTFGECQHVMALQQLLRPMLSEDAQAGHATYAAPVPDGADLTVH